MCKCYVLEILPTRNSTRAKPGNAATTIVKIIIKIKIIIIIMKFFDDEK